MSFAASIRTSVSSPALGFRRLDRLGGTPLRGYVHGRRRRHALQLGCGAGGSYEDLQQRPERRLGYRQAAQFKLLDLFALMINAPNFPEGFRAGYQLRGFKTGNARFPLSDEERLRMSDIRSRIACVLAECGFSEAAHACVNTPPSGLATAPDEVRVKVEAIVREVMQSMEQAER